ncbi:short-chain dehydrogenase [Streptomyces sp. NBC_01465]|uniref:short-chain dehydrogenase n=1 Tax=Streptomyces sp. NBC_01465 TaxID=2903878 RepID=UPI002E380703|nr:short-chain dehydrogenase [Streptomyces sp. NBC_01465]
MTKYGGRTAVVVDGATGLGLAIAKRLIEGGAKILVTTRTPTRTEAELGPCAQVLTSDRTDPTAIATLAPTVDYLFLPAGREIVLALLPVLRDGAAVVFTQATPRPALRALSAELTAHGIRVNAVAPDCGHAARTDAAARAALFLAADAPYTTCAQLPIATSQF